MDAVPGTPAMDAVPGDPHTIPYNEWVCVAIHETPHSTTFYVNGAIVVHDEGGTGGSCTIGDDTGDISLDVDIARILPEYGNEHDYPILYTPEPYDIVRFGGRIHHTKWNEGTYTIQGKSHGFIYAGLDITAEEYGAATVPDIIDDICVRFAGTRAIYNGEAITNTVGYCVTKKMMECIKELADMEDLDFTTDTDGNIILYQNDVPNRKWPRIRHGPDGIISRHGDAQNQKLSEVTLVSQSEGTFQGTAIVGTAFRFPGDPSIGE